MNLHTSFSSSPSTSTSPLHRGDIPPITQNPQQSLPYAAIILNRIGTWFFDIDRHCNLKKLSERTLNCAPANSSQPVSPLVQLFTPTYKDIFEKEIRPYLPQTTLLHLRAACYLFGAVVGNLEIHLTEVSIQRIVNMPISERIRAIIQIQIASNLLSHQILEALKRLARHTSRQVQIHCNFSARYASEGFENLPPEFVTKLTLPSQWKITNACYKLHDFTNLTDLTLTNEASSYTLPTQSESLERLSLHTIEDAFKLNLNGYKKLKEVTVEEVSNNLDLRTKHRLPKVVIKDVFKSIHDGLFKGKVSVIFEGSVKKFTIIRNGQNVLLKHSISAIEEKQGNITYMEFSPKNPDFMFIGNTQASKITQLENKITIELGSAIEELEFHLSKEVKLIVPPAIKKDAKS